MIQRDIGQDVRHLLLLVILTGFVLGGYLLTSKAVYGLGFPLDDAWIHQTYARNLIADGEWAFLPGRPSAGSTAPLWTLALALGYRLGLDPRTWSDLLGGSLLLATAWVCGLWFVYKTDKPRRWMLWGGSLVVLEWHLAWAAVSGMEILALAFVATFVLYRLDCRPFQAFYLGAAIGFGVWIRPDALSLLLPVGWTILVRDRVTLKRLVTDVGGVCLGLVIVIVPYGISNYQLSGTWWPSTFYAKSAEYAALRDTSIITRFLSQLSVPFIGAAAVLLPGILIAVLQTCREKRWAELAPLLWVIGFLAAYAWRLPVTYQHGRYAMPVIPVLLVIGSRGMFAVLNLNSDRMLPRLLSRTWPMAVCAAALAFLVPGSQAYARDVAIIETEMVRCAKWIEANTEPDAIVAAHDIGALGYFSGRDLLDLAGLISPEVIPFIRDEDSIAQYLTDQHAGYLMTFPGWYPSLVQRAERVYLTRAKFSPDAGGENMAVYRWTSHGLLRE